MWPQNHSNFVVVCFGFLLLSFSWRETKVCTHYKVYIRSRMCLFLLLSLSWKKKQKHAYILQVPSVPAEGYFEKTITWEKKTRQTDNAHSFISDRHCLLLFEVSLRSWTDTLTVTPLPTHKTLLSFLETHKVWAGGQYCLHFPPESKRKYF